MLQRLLLLPLLAPLLLVLLLAGLNPRPRVPMRVLVWRLPPLPLGAWIALAGSGGAVLSAGVTALALRQGGASLRPAPRQARRQEPPVAAAWGAAEPVAAGAPPAGSGFSGPQRAPQDPLPTISVPFRVLRRGNTPGPGPAVHSWPPAQPAAATAEGWDDPLNEDW